MNQIITVVFASVSDVSHYIRVSYIAKVYIHFWQVSLLTENGGTKDDLRLPTDENLLTQVPSYFNTSGVGIFS